MASETIKRVLTLPADTIIVWKSHDDSIAQRSALDQARSDKTTTGPATHGHEKRRQTLTSQDGASSSADRESNGQTGAGARARGA
jgi:translation initiation factor 4E